MLVFFWPPSQLKLRLCLQSWGAHGFGLKMMKKNFTIVEEKTAVDGQVEAIGLG